MHRFFTAAALFFTACVFLSNPLLAQPQSPARRSFQAMMTACENVQTLSFKMFKYERIDGRFTEATTQIKYRRSPYSVYIFTASPNYGREILFNKGQNKDEALINPGGFPYVTVSLSPYGTMMRSDNHFTIFDVGFETLAANLRHSLVALSSKFDEVYKLEGNLTWKGYTCEKLVLSNDDYKWINYTVPKAITLETLARGLHLGAYGIKERNHLSGYGLLKAGTVLQIPSTFVKKLILYLDKKTYLPVYQELHDDNGKFAAYEFQDLHVNPTLSNTDFSRDNPAYHF